LARDRVWLSCTMILPLRVRGGSGSLVRPIAIGAPGQR
jgi:kynurenine formamidase